ncbi:MAG: NUDIX domain-containing protein [Clostridiaceae bacterium]|nr:NUDIX domain-containing protein [Clostridiaceae bacterium]
MCDSDQTNLNKSTQAAIWLQRRLDTGGCDLHLHTSHSDGSDTPEQTVDRALSAGLRTIAITDHDNMSAYPDALKYLQACLLPAEEPRPVLIAGVELSVDDNGFELHLLGYFPFGGMERIERFLAEQQELRRQRNRQMIQRLQGLGYAISQDEFDAGGQGSAGRLQAAVLLCRKGYFQDIGQVFEQLLGMDKPGYVERPRPSVNDAIQLIREAGGVTVLAHPALYGWCGGRPFVSSRLLAKLTRLRAAGLQGVEAYHGEASRDEQQEVAAAGLVIGLINTAGSDDHGLNKKKRLMYSGSCQWTDRPVFLVAAALCPGPDRNGKATWLLGRRRTQGKLDGFWELPGGKVEPGETPAGALQREMSEEMAVQAKIGSIRLVLIHNDPEKQVILVLIDTQIGSQAIAQNAHDQFCYATAEEALALNLLPADALLIQKLAENS